MMFSTQIDKTGVSAGYGILNSGVTSEWIRCDSQVDLMSEANVYGTNVYSSNGIDTGEDNRQYALFQLKPELINSDGKSERFWYWLKNIATAEEFTHVGSGGVAYISKATSRGGVRPRFLIG